MEWPRKGAKDTKAKFLAGAEAGFHFTHWVKAMPAIKACQPSLFMRVSIGTDMTR
jgi:hypothetical protein